ncbi:MAG: HAMP domain-containing histidine kinase [Firmicutes bacterium]|nr:HAMP domain-containing histidine kinase [Bacillota bacterium]
MKIKSKILLLFFLSVLIITMSVSLYSIESLYSKNLSNAISEYTKVSREHVKSIENFLQSSDRKKLDGIYSYIEDFSSSSSRIYEIYLNESMVFKNHSIAIGGERKELKEDKWNYILRDHEGKLFLFVSGVFESDGRKIRVCNISDLSWIEYQRKQQYMYVFSILILVMFLGSIIIKKILDILFSDMDKLKIMSERIGQGDYSYSIESYGKDEIGKLVENFNQMGSLVNKQVDQIKKDKELKDRFLRNFNHEIKTPLTSIIGISDMLDKGLVKKEDEAEMISIINLEAKRILALQRVVLKELELDKIKKEKTSVKSLFEEIQYIYKYSSNQKNIDLIYQGEDYFIDVNPKLFIQAIGNIIENAIRYSQEGGSVIFKVDKDSISIFDDGPGLDLDLRDNIFQAFEKSKDSKGQGIGLYLTKKIVDKHGFSIRVESDDRGTVFKIKFK